MNILFRGPYPQRDGWGQASRDFIRALVLTGCDVQIIPIIMANLIGKELPEDIKNLENNQIPHVNIFLQHSLPSFMERRSQCFNIGLCATESAHLENTGWISNINEMDALLCWTENERKNLIESGARPPVFSVPQPMDTKFFDSVSEKFADPLVNDNFVFYFVGEWNERKNFNDLILAYWREFTRDDPVKLLLKVTMGGMSPDVLGKNLMNHIERLKSIYRMYSKASYYPEVVIISEYLSNEDLVKLHNSCDCFVTTSYGEATCIPLLNAIYLNKNVICTEGIGADDADFDMLRVKSREVPCLCTSPPLPYLYSGWETWRQIDVLNLQSAMRNVYDGKRQCKNDRAKVTAKYSYEGVAERIQNILRELHIREV